MTGQKLARPNKNAAVLFWTHSGHMCVGTRL